MLRAVLRRLLEPLCLILLAAAIISALSGDEIGGGIIITVLALSIGLDTFQEGRAVKAADLLRKSVALQAEVRRDGSFGGVAIDRVVPGDVLRIRAGDIVPADGLLLDDGGERALVYEGLCTFADPPKNPYCADCFLPGRAGSRSGLAVLRRWHLVRLRSTIMACHHRHHAPGRPLLGYGRANEAIRQSGHRKPPAST